MNGRHVPTCHLPTQCCLAASLATMAICCYYISRRVQAGRTEQKSGNSAAFRLPIRNNDVHGRPGMVRSGHSPAGLVPTVLFVHKPHVFVQLLFIEGPKIGSLQYADIAAHGFPATPEGASRHGTIAKHERTHCCASSERTKH